MLIIHYHHSDYLLWLLIIESIYLSVITFSIYNIHCIWGLSSFPKRCCNFIKTEPQVHITFMLKTDFLLSYKEQIL